METTILFAIPHVVLAREADGSYCLTVEDTELNDFVEDFLWDDYEYQATGVSIEPTTNLAIYRNYFDADFPVDGLVAALKQLDVAEVEKVFRLNN